MSNNLEINIKAATTGSEKVDALKQKIESFGNIQAFKKLKKDVQDSKSAWENATKKVADLAKEMRASETPTKKFSNELNAIIPHPEKRYYCANSKMVIKGHMELSIPGIFKLKIIY